MPAVKYPWYPYQDGTTIPLLVTNASTKQLCAGDAHTLSMILIPTSAWHVGLQLLKLNGRSIQSATCMLMKPP